MERLEWSRSRSFPEALQADDLGSHIGQHHPAEWPGTDPTQFENRETLQRTHTCDVRSQSA